MKEHRDILVKGKVKEIDFLYYTEMFAIKKNINGFIQNGSVSQVYIEAEASKEKLDELEDYLKNSPLGLHVNSLNATPGNLKDFKSFKIKRESKPENKPGFFQRLKNLF